LTPGVSQKTYTKSQPLDLFDLMVLRISTKETIRIHYTGSQK